MAASHISLAEATEKAVSAWLKASLEFSTMKKSDKEALDIAIELTSLSAAYVVHCAESHEAANGNGLVFYLSKKSVAMVKLFDVSSLQCVAAVVDFGLDVSKEGPQLVAGLATSATGISMLLGIQAGLSLLLQADKVWIHCAPLVRQWVRSTQDRLDLERIRRDRTGKIIIILPILNPNDLICRAT